MTSTRSTTGSILDIKGEKMMNTGKGTWTEGQRKMLFSLMEKVDFSKEDMENSLKFPMSELSVQEASILIDCLKNNGDLSEAVGKIKGSHGNAPKGPLDRIPDKTDKTSETPAMPKTREEALQKKQQKETQKIVPAPEQGNTQTVEFSNEKPYLPIDLVDIDRAIALYEKFEYAKRKLAKPEDIQDGGNRKFYKKSFWRKAGTAFFVDYQVVGDPIIQQFGSEIVCTIKAVARWGNRTLTDVGVCSSKEFTGRRVFNFPDLISTATTRAINRVISDMIGGGEVTADEIQGETV